jgi:cell division protease FtsH
VTWRSEEVGSLISVLGAMAAELVFYGQNGRGVGGDLGMATARAAMNVGGAGMAPQPIDLSDRIEDKEKREEEEEKVMERFEKLGTKLLHRSAGMDGSSWGSVLMDGSKRKLVTGMLGQAFVIAYRTIEVNKEATERIADRLVAELEMYGDDVTDMLDEARLVKPEIDVLDEETWPKI